jgi:glycosyltransferase involved in cell wall biosynthesis
VLNEPIRVLVVGLRCLPETEGGVERHAEALYPRLARLGCEVEVAVRTPFCSKNTPKRWRGITLKRIWAPRTGGLEPLVHTLLATCYAAVRRPDILHIHAVGPALMTPLARWLGLRVVVTHHGPDYDREKWGGFARWILRLGESLGMRFSNERIVISQTIEQLVESKYHARTSLIPNGVRARPTARSTGALAKFGLTPQRYVLQVSRFVPEKRQLDLIDAFAAAGLEGWHLVLVGGCDETDGYCARVAKRAGEVPGVTLTGFRAGRDLHELYSHAGMFVLPSSHEGLPLVLLEALSYGLPVVASAIPAHLEVALEKDHYFPQGDVTALATRLRERANATVSEAESRRLRRWVATTYDWDEIARQTLAVYQHGTRRRPVRALPPRRGRRPAVEAPATAAHVQKQSGNNSPSPLP